MKETLITLFDALVLGFFAVKTVDGLRWLFTWLRVKIQRQGGKNGSN